MAWKRVLRKIEPGPRLCELLASGDIWIDEEFGMEYVGLASDGVEVNIGTVGQEDALEWLLSLKPTPEDW